MILFLILSLELLLGPDHDLKTCSAILICRSSSKSHTIHFGPIMQPLFPSLYSHFCQVRISMLLFLSFLCFISSLGRRAYGTLIRPSQAQQWNARKYGGGPQHIWHYCYGGWMQTRGGNATGHKRRHSPHRKHKCREGWKTLHAGPTSHPPWVSWGN